MDFLVYPVDGERVKVLERQRAPEARPLVRCPECGKYFLFTSGGALDEGDGTRVNRAPGPSR